VQYCDIISTIGSTPARLAVERGADGGASFAFDVEHPGLFQLSVIVDASRHDWEELYLNLHKFGNTGQRTGPWDFDLLNNNSPLVPAFRVSVDGRSIGLWFFQRVSLEDIEHKRFRGNAAMWLRAAGAHRITLVPFRPMNVSWLSARLEQDPEDTLERLPAGIKPAPGHTPVARWVDDAFWAQQRDRLRGSHAAFAPKLHSCV
jgi:hypothetical protein